MLSVGKLFAIAAMFVLLSFIATSKVEGRWHQEPSKVESSTIKGKVFRSDSNEAISNSYILLEKDPPARAEHFDLRTDENGNYRFSGIPAGKYTVSVYGWFPKKSDVPCQNSPEVKATDEGKVTVRWQYKSQAFMEIVTIKGVSVDAGQEIVKDFNLFCK